MKASEMAVIPKALKVTQPSVLNVRQAISLAIAVTTNMVTQKPADFLPPDVGQIDLPAHDRTQWIPSHHSSTGNDHRQQNRQYGRLDLDKKLIVKIDRKPPKKATATQPTAAIIEIRRSVSQPNANASTVVPTRTLTLSMKSPVA